MSDWVLLCYSRNTPYDYDAHTPVSILALGTFLETHGVAVEYYDERIESSARFDELLAQGPLAVGFSVIGGYQIESAARLSLRVRSRAPRATVVWGGIFPTTLPELTLAESFVDVVVVGEGEETLLDLVHTLRGGGELSGVRGLVFRDGAEVVRTAARPLPDVESLPFVYQGKALALLRRYIARGSIREAVGFEVSRGCPFLCTFCYSPNFHATTRTKSVGKVREELARLRGLGVDDIDIYDDTLFGARRREFSAYLAPLRELGFSWIGNLRINMLDEVLLGEIVEAGCKWLYFGIESRRDDVLRALKKGVTSAQVEAGIRLMSRAGIPAVYSLLFGLPLAESTEAPEEVIAFAEWIHAQHPEAEIQLQSFVPLPGATLFREAVERGFEPPTDMFGWARLDHFSTESPWLVDPSLGSKLYISSFLAFRYRRHFSKAPYRWVAWPMSRLARWRLAQRNFDHFVERWAYRAMLEANRLRTALHYAGAEASYRLRRGQRGAETAEA
jgi:anaerobic magnesium-protoporphyrin IX monomethyl ester cyclase